MAQLLPLAALQGKERSTEALKGDIYTRRWFSTKGKGKKKREVEHTVHVNPITAIVAVAGGTIAAGVAAWVGMRTLKQTGYQLTTGSKTMVRVLRVYEPETVITTVVDTPAYSETKMYSEIIWENRKVYPQQDYMTSEQLIAAGIPPPWGLSEWQMVNVGTREVPRTTFYEEVSHPESHTTGQRAVVFTKRGVPIRQWKSEMDESIALEWPQCLSKRQMAEGWTWQDTMGQTSGTDRYGDYTQAAYVLVNPKMKYPQLAPFTPPAPAEKTSLITIDLWPW